MTTPGHKMLASARMATTKPAVSIVYITVGAKSGACTHMHKSLESAAACLRKHRAECSGKGGASDREVSREWGPLTADESHAVQAMVGA